MNILFIWTLINILIVTALAMEPEPGSKREEDKDESHGKRLLIDLNLPAPTDSDENRSISDSQEQGRKKQISWRTRQNNKRKERMKVDPIYAAARRATLAKSAKKWRIKRDANLSEEKRKELSERKKIANHKHYLKRKSTFGGHHTKEAQEVARIIAIVRKGEEITPEDRQKVVEYRGKRKKIAETHKLKMKNLGKP
ncbi:uncharacterized protein FA14DRAFT_156420 [Meira miltonrushii]|uniref:Uncharacterized protein n=1 Tax=Meira miltonrushii TaxID=1280837 RepID=A0A316V7Z6_9BASI|nr:uncharacterized protein FA14DRAFT_156420 [Meira miltonrushii]PWN33737.1 hypothetical protein FA14DRAFT_156420 [Meira miltonrushii]